MAAPGAAKFVPSDAPVAELRKAVQGCRGCDLYRHATQAVFGEGPESADVVMVGEQPGDHEDIDGHPFVGPAGQLLDRALAEAGIERDRLYLTNVVRHFKFVERGKRRIHKQPGRTEIVACSAWFDAELAAIEPRLVVCLGAVAAHAVLGASFKVSTERGKLIDGPGYTAVATVHPQPSYDPPDRASAYEEFVRDLKKVSAAINGG